MILSESKIEHAVDAPGRILVPIHEKNALRLAEIGQRLKFSTKIISDPKLPVPYKVAELVTQLIARNYPFPPNAALGTLFRFRVLKRAKPDGHEFMEIREK
ncbi:MAG: hypothetical protein V1787_03910 [Candidatus Micrarchaeota archaeon]